jgi:hypothetical protein
MLRAVIKKILGLFSVTKDDLPEVEAVEYGSGAGFAIYRVGGRPVVVGFSHSSDNQGSIQISKAQFVDFHNEEPNDSNRNYPRPIITKFYDEPVSTKEKEALFRFFERADYKNQTCERINGDLVIKNSPLSSSQPMEPGAKPHGLKANDVQPR